MKRPKIEWLGTVGGLLALLSFFLPFEPDRSLFAILENTPLPFFTPSLVLLTAAALALRERILSVAHEQTRMPVSNLDLVDGQIVRKSDGRILKSLGDLATESLYSLENSQHITAETTAQIKSNAYSFGCSFAEVEVDIPM